MATTIPDPVAMARARAEYARDVDKVRAVLLEQVMQRVVTSIESANALGQTSARFTYRDLAPAVLSLPCEVVGAMMELPGGAGADAPQVIARLLDMETIVYPHVRDRLTTKSEHYRVTLPSIVELDVGWAVPAAPSLASLSAADQALVAQAMAMTQEQIDRMPPADRAKVVALLDALAHMQH